MKLYRLIAPVAMAAAAMVATPASAALVVNSDGSITITGSSGGTGTINFDGNSDGSTVPGMTSELTLTFVQAVAGTYTFDYTLENTSTSPTTAARITAFTMDTDPNIVANGAAIISGSVFDEIRLNRNFPNGVGNVEVCFTTGNCTGGGSAGDGVQIGGSTNGRFTLDFGDANLGTLTLANLHVRYQGITAPGISGGSGTGSYVPPPPPAVPEPGTWAMMLVGFGAIGFSMRSSRRRRGLLAQAA